MSQPSGTSSQDLNFPNGVGPERADSEQTGCPWRNATTTLRHMGLRPTRQRMALAWMLFGKGCRHLTAEMLHAEAVSANIAVSLATVYNTLNQFTQAGVLRRIAVHGSGAHFDTDVSDHLHFFFQDDSRIVDIPADNVAVGQMPTPPSDYEIQSVDIVVRLVRKGKV